MKEKTIKKLISIGLILMMVMSTAAMGFAEDGTEEPVQKKAQTETQVEKEKPEAEEEKVQEEAPAEEPVVTPEPPQEEPQEAPAPESEKVAEKKASKKESSAEQEQVAEQKTAKEKSSIKKLKKSPKALTDGTYKPSTFSFSGGTGKAKLTCDQVILKDGKATAIFRASSEKMTHAYLGTVPEGNEDTSLFDPASGKMGKDVYRIIDQVTYVPVVLEEEGDIAARTTAMSEPHWINYKYKITLAEDAQKLSDDTTIPTDYSEETQVSTELKGTYKVDSFTFKGGTGKATVNCDRVIIENGKVTALFKASSNKMSHIYMGTAGTNEEDKTLYDPSKDQGKAGVYRFIGQNAYVPVTLNKDMPAACRTTAMTVPHWVQYTYHIALSDNPEKISDETTVPEGYAVDVLSGDSGEPGGNSGEPGGQTTPTKPTDPTPTTTSKLSDGTWKVKATTDRVMFNLYPKEKDPVQVILVKKGNKMTATITLNGDGYDYVYMGTPAQAKKAGIKNWSKAKIVNGYYTFTVPVSALDKKLAITPHSKKYETDGNPGTDPWRAGKWIIFYSAGAVKVKDGTTVAPTKPKAKEEKYATSGKQGKIKLTDKKKDKVSKWKDDRGKSTSAVNNKTSLKDGVYAPDRFSWSGGSGRLAYIKCTKITVTGGKAYATIVFGSSKYDSLKASGRVFSKSGGGNSTFTIPIKLNANNTIIGRTTAMSQPHWIKYNIFVYKKGATGASADAAKGDDGHLTSTKKLSDKAPDLLGLKVKKGKVVEKAEYFKIFRYEKGITLISLDQAKDTALYKEEKKEAAEKKADAQKKEQDNGEKIEYDEEGKPIARSQNEITADLYQNNVVNYLVVPKGVEIPAGLDKDCIIIQQPVKSTYVFDNTVASELEQLKHMDDVSLLGMDEADLQDAARKALDEGKVKVTGDVQKPDYAQVVKEKVKLAVLPGSVLPEKVKAEEKGLLGGSDNEEAKKESEQKTKNLAVLQKRFAALSIPMLVDRADAEKSNYAKAEWIKVYGAIYGEEDLAKKVFQKYMKDHKEKKLKGKSNDEK
ncbi:hypothetical protein [Eubacterium sp. AB3007]|uniref:hypothetical protein n=1 Tax=Eubacterium sp. AB3007 TaxID=1392487 RepID=UPI0004811C13|nr:hypothetical protein [Eubacterium sp. AB3007]